MQNEEIKNQDINTCASGTCCGGSCSRCPCQNGEECNHKDSKSNEVEGGKEVKCCKGEGCNICTMQEECACCAG